VEKMKSADTRDLRKRLLAIPGVGAETADSILLYALDKPVFVVDAYTKRVLQNHRIYEGIGDYDAIQAFFTHHLPRDLYLYNEFHALIVRLAQQFCKGQPVCRGCPLETEGKGRGGEVGRSERVRRSGK
jgi:endonuclease III related protein